MSTFNSTTEIEETNLKFLCNNELRSEICDMAQVDVENPFDKERRRSRRYTQSERIDIIMYILEQSNTFNSFVESAVKEKLQRANGKTQNQILDSLTGIGLEEYGNVQNGAKKINREELKRLYNYLEKINGQEESDTYCWNVNGLLSGVSDTYPVESEYDPNQEVTILFW